MVNSQEGHSARRKAHGERQIEELRSRACELAGKIEHGDFGHVIGVVRRDHVLAEPPPQHGVELAVAHPVNGQAVLAEFLGRRR